MRIDRLQDLLGTLEAAGVASVSQLRVEQVMTARPTCIPPTTDLLALVQLFHERGFRHPLVTDEQGNLVGVISDRDVIRCFGPGQGANQEVLQQISASQIMSTDLITISAKAGLDQAVNMFLDYGINCLPVMQGPKLVGILTTTDLFLVLKALVQASETIPQTV